MSEIHVHQFISLDGVADAPSGRSSTSSSPRWRHAPAPSPTRSTAILLGRNTYEMFEPAWSTRTVEDDPGAPFFNKTKKYVVSGTLHGADLEQLGDRRALRPGPIRRLKDEVDGNIFVSGSTTLVRALLADGLVDGLHVFLYPLTRGAGARLLDGVPAITFTCEETQTYSHGMTYLHYRPKAV